LRQNEIRGGPQPAFCTIAGHRIPDLSARGEPDSYPRALLAAIGSGSGLQNHAGSGGATPRGGDAQKLSPGFEFFETAGHDDPSSRRLAWRERRVQAESRLRPLARRDAKTRRPAAVAILARKP
jgi:hypothetical protein